MVVNPFTARRCRDLHYPELDLGNKAPPSQIFPIALSVLRVHYSYFVLTYLNLPLTAALLYRTKVCYGRQ